MSPAEHRAFIRGLQTARRLAAGEVHANAMVLLEERSLGADDVVVAIDNRIAREKAKVKP